MHMNVHLQSTMSAKLLPSVLWSILSPGSPGPRDTYDNLWWTLVSSVVKYVYYYRLHDYPLTTAPSSSPVLRFSSSLYHSILPSQSTEFMFPIVIMLKYRKESLNQRSKTHTRLTDPGSASGGHIPMHAVFVVFHTCPIQVILLGHQTKRLQDGWY